MQIARGTFLFERCRRLGATGLRLELHLPGDKLVAVASVTGPTSEPGHLELLAQELDRLDAFASEDEPCR